MHQEEAEAPYSQGLAESLVGEQEFFLAESSPSQPCKRLGVFRFRGQNVLKILLGRTIHFLL